MRSWRNIRRISSRRTYTVREAARALGTCKETILRMIQTKMLPKIEGNIPYWIRGVDLIQALTFKRNQARFSLAPDELPCFKCRSPRKGKPETLTKEYTLKRIGRQKLQTVTTAICEICGSNMYRRGAYLPSERQDYERSDDAS